MVCSYCDLKTDGGKNHGTTEECIQALAAETQRLRDDVKMLHEPAHGRQPGPERKHHPSDSTDTIRCA